MATLGPFKLPSVAATAVVTGTLTAGVDESSIVAGGETIIITLTNATWVAAGAAFDAIRQDIINGIDSAQAEATGWDAVVIPAIAVTGVVRTSDSVVTITLPAVAGYDITAAEELTVTVPLSATDYALAIVATPTITITPTAAFDFLMVLTPVVSPGSASINVNAAYEVDWGDGSFIAYSAGTNSSAVLGTVTVRSANSPTSFRVLSDQFTAINVSQSSTITTLASAFFGLTNLVTVSIADTSGVTSMSQTFRNCSSLVSVPAMDTSLVTDMTFTFLSCSSLLTIPALDTSSVSIFLGTFSNCANLISVPALSTASATDFRVMFSNCSRLRCIAGLDTTPVSGTTNKANMLNNCYRLKHPVPRTTLSVSETDPLISSAGSAYTNGSPGDCNDFLATGDLFGRIEVVVGDSNRIAINTVDPFTVPDISQVVFAWEDQVFDINAWTSLGGGVYSATIVGHEAEPVRLKYLDPSVTGTGNGDFLIQEMGFLNVITASVSQVGLQGVKLIYV